MEEVTEKCKAGGDVVAITFDFMQNLPLPHIPVEDIFYLRQRWVYTVGIHNLKTSKTHFF
jgi:hypothetical protein